MSVNLGHILIATHDMSLHFYKDGMFVLCCVCVCVCVLAKLDVRGVGVSMLHDLILLGEYHVEQREQVAAAFLLVLDSCGSGRQRRRQRRMVVVGARQAAVVGSEGQKEEEGSRPNNKDEERQHLVEWVIVLCEVIKPHAVI